MSTCNHCTDPTPRKTPETIPYIVYEAEKDRDERRHTSALNRIELQAKRWMVMCFVLVGALVALVAGFLIYESQYETYYYEQDGEGVNTIGDENEVNDHGTEAEN